jgi:hypothetical protein
MTEADARDHITIVVRDLPLTDWGIRCGAATRDLELGFDSTSD